MKKLEIGVDKLLHYTCCAIITALVFCAFVLAGAPHLPSIAAGFATAMVIGFAKEFYDKTHGGFFDWRDVIADTVGASFSSLVLLGNTLLTAIVVCVLASFVLFFVKLKQ